MQGTDDEAWSPATIFVVSDHLHHLLVRNMFRRDPTPGAPGCCGFPGLRALGAWHFHAPVMNDSAYV